MPATTITDDRRPAAGRTGSPTPAVVAAPAGHPDGVCPGCGHARDPREARPALEFTIQDVRDELQARLRHENADLAAWCVVHAVDPTAADAFAAGRKMPREDLLRVLGLEGRLRFVARRA